MSKFENIMFILLFAIGFIGFTSIMVMAYRHDMACVEACSPEPVAQCYRDRAFCAGMGNQYMVPVK